jgi:PAS domain S-box-containing protein
MQVTLPRILILEDVEDDAELMLLELRQAGLCGASQRVWTQAAFAEAASRFLPHVILADFSLPGIDGVAALEIRQLLCPDTPFIIVSGSLGEERAVRVLKAGATDYVLKHDLARLVPAVRRALAESSAQRDRRRIARQLDAERRLLSAVLDRSAALIALIDTSGRLVRINAAAAEACGVAEAQAHGHPYWSLFAEPGRAALSREALLRIRESRPAAPPQPWRETTRTGRVILWSASLLDEPGSSGEAIVLAGIDVSGQQREDEARARLATIVDSSDDAILSKTLDGVITSWNRGAERIFGYTAAEAIGRNARMLVPPRHEADEQQILERLRLGESVSHFETVRLRKDGQEISVSTTVSPMRDAAGHIVCASTITRDISQRKRLEELRLRSIELEAENRRVLEANRLKSEFLANMSHELRTPLNAVIGFADLLREGRVPPDSPKHREFLNHISHSGQHLLQLINDILDLSKVEAGKLEFSPEPVDLARMVHEVTTILGSAAAAKQIPVRLDLDPALGPLRIDPARLKQVLYNYLSNALKFTPLGGSVVVRTRGEGERMFRIEVEDTGIGIPSQQLGRLFVEFEQLDTGRTKNHAGTGLGLALTRRLVEAQGGRVGVRSAPGQGSVFHAILPRQPQDGGSPPPRRVAAAAGPQGPQAQDRKASVLVVEDDPQDQAALISTLTSAGFEVETAATGAQAVARARDKAFTALTLDLLLPDMPGLDMLASIRREGPNRAVPVVAVTVAAARQAPAPGAGAWGRPSLAGFAVSDVLPEPVRADALRAALQRIDSGAGAPGPVLVLHPDRGALQAMADTLRQIGYHAVCRDGGARALRELDALQPHAIILDLLLQDLDGVAFLAQLRQLPRWRHTPVFLWADKELGAAQQARLAASAQTALHHGQGGMDTLLQDLDALRPARRPMTGKSHGPDARSDH